MLDNDVLKSILNLYAPGVDAEGDGVFDLQWRSTETFYRHTEEYVPIEKRATYKAHLERHFPGRRGVL